MGGSAIGGRAVGERACGRAGERAGEGVVIADRYELGSQLGVGGMGVVWRGRDRRLARAVADRIVLNGRGQGRRGQGRRSVWRAAAA